MSSAQENAVASTLHTAPSPWILWCQVALLVFVTGILYLGVVSRLVTQWWNDPNFSHGFFVPAFSAFLVWKKKDELAKLTVKPSWAGLLIVAAALTELIVGVMGAELFLSRSSLILLAAGLIISFLGWAYFRALLFPWAFLLLMVPIPNIIFNHIAFPLQFVASDLASWLLSLLGVPVLLEGNVIHLPNMSLEVVEACSGIRSLVSLLTLAIIYGSLLESRIVWRVLLALAAIPIAVAANGLRVMGTGLMGVYWSPDKAEGFFHTFSGWVIFLLSLGFLFTVHGAMRMVDRWRGVRQ